MSFFSFVSAIRLSNFNLSSYHIITLNKGGKQMTKKHPKILILMKPFGKFPKHQPKVDMIQALEQYAEVYYWSKNGHIQDILKKLAIEPDFILHYDIAWNSFFAPRVEGLDEVKIPTGCFVIDLHWKPEQRIKYINDNQIDIIFSVSKHPFLKLFPQFNNKMYWTPWAINPKIMKDWRKRKDIDCLLMGLVYVDHRNLAGHTLPRQLPSKGRYAFRDAVFEQMKTTPGFVFHPHPGHLTIKSDLLLANKAYAEEINRAKIFYTCGSRNTTGGIAVLKFFEVPACHTLLLAETNEDIEELGFKDTVNFVACTIEEIKEKTNFYLTHDSIRQKITKNGYEFIHQHHTIHHRARQMIEEIKKLIS